MTRKNAKKLQVGFWNNRSEMLEIFKTDSFPEHLNWGFVEKHKVRMGPENYGI